jgi:hypothetical protein
MIAAAISWSWDRKIRTMGTGFTENNLYSFKIIFIGTALAAENKNY